ncbi:MAG: hypothetical protein ABGF52_01290 [Candidatus Asgardarchaeum sp.]
MKNTKHIHIYVAIRLGEVPEVLSGIKEFTSVVTLYTFRRIIRFKLEAIQDAPP